MKTFQMQWKKWSVISPEKDKSNDWSSEEEALSLKRRSKRSATEGGTLSMNCSSMLQNSPNQAHQFYTLLNHPNQILLLSNTYAHQNQVLAPATH